ncbi:MAG: formate/nitrite transporter family protein [Bacteroidaceae bacterium]|nr:formate/nitrite transporter family protein [Bacteroidaceae bacterium]
MNAISTLKSSILAGVCIGIAGFGFLSSKDIIGTVLFTFGLLAVVHYGFKLYTGTVGFMGGSKGLAVKEIPLVLLGNIIGTLLVALLSYASPNDLQSVAQGILEARLKTGILPCGLLAIGCGFIMTTAVKFAKFENRWLPLLFGVSIFIVCGFPHCIADAFYYLAVPVSFWQANLFDILLLYISIVIGNGIGCNLVRLIMWNKEA